MTKHPNEDRNNTRRNWSMQIRTCACVRVCVFVACLLYKLFSKKLRIDKTDVFPIEAHPLLFGKISFKNKTEQIVLESLFFSNCLKS